MKLISGLGNPTRKYRLTRHNVGFLAIDRISKDLSVKLKKSAFSSLIGKGKLGEKNFILLKPLTFMNLSGKAIGPFAEKKEISPEDIIVICDDINLDFGKIRIRKSGSNGGHKGLKSIIEHLGTENFARLRIGIGKENIERKNLSEYVLEDFSKKELILIYKVLGVISNAIKTYIKEGIKSATEKYNNIKIS